MALRCNKKRKLNSRDAYTQLKDSDRDKLEASISNKIQSFGIQADGEVVLEGEQQTGMLLESGFWKGRTGLFLTRDSESLPVFGPVGDIENIWARASSKEGPNGEGGPAGARIILTKDNYGSRASGMGGKGFSMCEAIDIVAGSLSCEKTLKTGACRSRANFATDGSRIYLTERGDIQNYFGLGEAASAVSVSSDLKSGIGIKADHTLIIGRELVRIVAGLGNFEGGERLVNQQDYDKGVIPRIELAAVGDIAQPAVLGNALTQRLDQVKDEFINVYQKIWEMEQKLIQFKYSLAFHVHSGAGIGAIQTFPDPVLVSEAMQGLAKPQSGFLDVTRREITDTMNLELDNYSWKGIKSEGIQEQMGQFLNPSRISALLSRTGE